MHRFHEGNANVISQVITRLRSVPAGLAPGRTESEQVAENISETGKNIFESAKTRKAGAFQPLVPILVVDTALFIIPEDLVCFGSFLELFFGFPVSRVSVRMKLQGQFPIGLFQL